MSEMALHGLKLVFYTDARHFGGHEVASLRALLSMLQSGAHAFALFRHCNSLLREQLHALQRNYPNLQIHPLSMPSLKYPALGFLLYNNYLRQIQRLFNALSPDLIFISQGNLINSWAGAKVARKLDLPCVSYIPMAQPLRMLLGTKGWIRGLLGRQVVHWPSQWLTGTKRQVEYLRTAGARQPIDILPNPIILPHHRSREQARKANQIPADVLVIGMVGRLNNRQKGCDLFIKALLGAAPESRLRTAWLLFIGDGEERATLLEKLSNAGWYGRVRCTGWTNEPWNHYAALDLLVMPSRFEGQPLAMQEALFCNVPVCGSRIDGLQGYLPDEWLCPPNNCTELRKKMETMLGSLDNCKITLDILREHIETENGIEIVTDRLSAAIKRML
jgi:glycosyltransferase involved in cell wall biosynthesis